MKRALIIVIGVLIIPFIGLLYYQFFVFHITGTNPGTRQVSNISPFIDINFNKALDEDNIEVNVVEAPITGYDVVNEKTLRIGLGPMDARQEYTIEISKIHSKKGEELVNKTVRFTAKQIPFEKLPKSQKEAILKAQDSSNGSKADPILTHLPYDGLNYKLEALYENDSLTIHAELILTAADIRIDREGAIEQYKTQVKDYIASIGFRPDDYNIQYEVTEPGIY